MQRIRVLLVQVPGMLYGILTDIIGREPDMELVGHMESYDGLLPAIRRTEADVVVWGLQPVVDRGDAVPHECLAVLHAHPHLKVVAIEADGRSGSLYELRPRRRELGELASDRIVEAIRGGDLGAGIGRSDMTGTARLEAADPRGMEL